MRCLHLNWKRMDRKQREERRVSDTAFNISTSEWKLFYYPTLPSPSPPRHGSRAPETPSPGGPSAGPPSTRLGRPPARLPGGRGARGDKAERGRYAAPTVRARPPPHTPGPGPCRRRGPRVVAEADPGARRSVLAAPGPAGTGTAAGTEAGQT